MDFPHYGAPLTETGHILGFWALSGEHVGVNVKGGAEGIFPTLCVEFFLVSSCCNTWIHNGSQALGHGQSKLIIDMLNLL